MVALEQSDADLPSLCDTDSDDDLPTDLPPAVPQPRAEGNLTPQVTKADIGDEDSDEGPYWAVEEDSWEFNGSAFIRHHRQPRRTLFSPALCDFLRRYRLTKSTSFGSRSLTSRPLTKSGSMTAGMVLAMTYVHYLTIGRAPLRST